MKHIKHCSVIAALAAAALTFAGVAPAALAANDGATQDAVVATRSFPKTNAVKKNILAEASSTQFVGKVPYVSGGNTPSGWDCSGFVQYVYGQMGVSLPHYSGAQATVGRAVGSLADAQPGDIIANAQHAAIYVGNGMVINSQLNGTRYDPIAWVFPSSYSIRRIF